MKEIIKSYAEYAALTLEFIGITVIAVVTLYIIAYGIIKMLQQSNRFEIYELVRKRLGYGILLGLEILVGADIVHTVAVDLSFSTVGVLAIIVIIRTVLSFSLDVEIKGKWPWQEKKG
ncbi:MAG: DUF1622 domain-containing protein [Cyclobacteriaceae bacterium]|nr:DUF1622 domain-containing protein [Cyclobacteriaceae bacterium]